MALLEDDRKYLEASGFEFEAIDQPGETCLVIKGFKLPEHYTPGTVEMLIKLPMAFPNSNPDMFWTNPTVTLAKGGTPLRADVYETYLGRSWQRWSRHWSAPWRPGVDGLNTYLASIRSELMRGL